MGHRGPWYSFSRSNVFLLVLGAVVKSRPTYVELGVLAGTLLEGVLVGFAAGVGSGVLDARVDARGAERAGCAESGAADDGRHCGGVCVEVERRVQLGGGVDDAASVGSNCELSRAWRDAFLAVDVAICDLASRVIPTATSLGSSTYLSCDAGYSVFGFFSKRYSTIN